MGYIEQFICYSKTHESIFVGYLWNSPSLYSKYKARNITNKTFTEKIWWFYYKLGEMMYDNGIRSFDDITVYSFVSSQPKEKDKTSWMDAYNNFGGYSIVEDIMNDCQSDKKNDEYHINEIQKYEILRYYQDEGLIDINKTIDKKGEKIKLVDLLCQMSLTQLKMYFQMKHKQAAMHVNSGEVIVHNLLQDMKDAMQELNKGESMGLYLNEAPRLNKKIKGWKLGNLMYLVLSSGIGKTSIAMEKFILALIDNDEKGLIFANEEGVLKFRALLLATVSSTKTDKGNPITRERIIEGHYTKEEWDKLNRAEAWLSKYRPDLIKFIELKKYRMEDVINNIELYRALGYKHILFDTFKPDLSRGESARWERFSENATELHDCIKESNNNCACLATVQLKIGKEYRYLDLSTIGKSLEIVEVAGTVLIGRLLYSDEYPGEKNELNPYNYVENKFNGQYIKEDYILDSEKQYLIIFIPKNRFGGTEEQVLFEIDYSTNKWKEVAYVKVPRTSNIY